LAALAAFSASSAASFNFNASFSASSALASSWTAYFSKALDSAN